MFIKNSLRFKFQLRKLIKKGSTYTEDLFLEKIELGDVRLELCLERTGIAAKELITRRQLH